MDVLIFWFTWEFEVRRLKIVPFLLVQIEKGKKFYFVIYSKLVWFCVIHAVSDYKEQSYKERRSNFGKI